MERADRLDGTFRVRLLADMAAALDGVEVISP
jgi:hypothetical protein